MEFFKNIVKSIYSPKYYQEVLAKPFSYSLKYYLKLALLVAVIATIVFSFILVPIAKYFVNEFGPQILNYYPQDLKITIKDGQVSTNVQEPYFIKLPDQFKNSERDVNNLPEFENILVIDTKNSFSVENFTSYKTFALLTKDSIISYKQGGINIQPLDKSINYVIDKNIVNSLYEGIKPFLGVLYYLIPVLIFIVFSFIFVFQFVYMLFGALIVWLASAIKKVKTGYAKSYQLGLHLLTPVILVNFIFSLLGVNKSIPFLFTILLLVFALFNISKINSSQNQ